MKVSERSEKINRYTEKNKYQQIKITQITAHFSRIEESTTNKTYSLFSKAMTQQRLQKSIHYIPKTFFKQLLTSSSTKSRLLTNEKLADWTFISFDFLSSISQTVKM